MPSRHEERTGSEEEEPRIRLSVGHDPFAILTKTERRVLNLIADGLTNREIAERLGLAEKTVKNHVTQILRKLQLPHRTEAALFAVTRALREFRTNP